MATTFIDSRYSDDREAWRHDGRGLPSRSCRRGGGAVDNGVVGGDYVAGASTRASDCQG